MRIGLQPMSRNSPAYVTFGLVKAGKPVEGKGIGQIDLAAEHASLKVNGKEVATATGAAVLGHPAEAIAWAANFLATHGHAIEAGWVVMTGGMTDAFRIEPNSEVTATFSNLGSVTVSRGE